MRGPNRLGGTCAQSLPCTTLLHDGRNHRVISRLVHLLLLRKSATSCIDQHANAPGHKSVRQVQNQAAAIRRRRCFCRTSSNGQKSRISTVSTQLSPSVNNSGSYQSLVVPTAPYWHWSHPTYRVDLDRGGHRGQTESARGLEKWKRIHNVALQSVPEVRYGHS